MSLQKINLTPISRHKKLPDPHGPERLSELLIHYKVQFCFSLKAHHTKTMFNIHLQIKENFFRV